MFLCGLVLLMLGLQDRMMMSIFTDKNNVYLSN